MSEKRQHTGPGNLDPTCAFDTSEFELNKNGLNKSLQMAIRKDFIFGWRHICEDCIISDEGDYRNMVSRR